MRIILFILVFFIFSCQAKQKNTIQLLSNVNNLFVGVSNFQDVRQELGSPDKIGKSSAGNAFIEYKDMGITVVFNHSNLNDANNTIDGFSLREPFNGKSDEGIYLGMNANRCIEILKGKYSVVHELNGTMSFADSPFNAARKVTRIWIDYTSIMTSSNPRKYVPDKITTISINEAW